MMFENVCSSISGRFEGRGCRRPAYLLAALIAAFAASPTVAEGADAYIASATDGKVYSIDTGYVPGPQTAVYADFEFLEVNGKDQQFVFEANGTGNARARIYINGSGNLAWSFTEVNPDATSAHWQSTGVEMVPGTRYKMKVDALNRSASLEYGGTSESFKFASNAAESMHATSTIKIFSSAGMSSNAAKMKLYAFQIYEAGELVHDYTPAIKDGIAGLVDSKTGLFIYDTRYSGYNEFTTGGDIPTIDDDPYVESDGTSAINLDVSASPRLKIEVDFAFTDVSDPNPESTTHWQQRLFGEDSVSSTPRISVYINNSQNLAIASGDGWNAVSTGLLVDLRRHKFVIDNLAFKSAYMTGVTTNWSGYGATKADLTKSAARPLALFGNTTADDGSTFGNLTKAKVYSVKIWAGGELIRDLAPRCINGVAGFEDLAFGGFYTCAGLTASANAPTELSNDYAKEGDPWVESDGSFYSIVNTYYMDGQNSKIEVDFQLAKIVSGVVVAGHFDNDFTDLIYCSGTTDFVLESKDGNYAGSFGIAHQDLARHTAVVDSPAKTFSLLAPDGTLEAQKTPAAGWTYTKKSNWPFILFGSATDAYGHNKQRSRARIYGVRFYEKAEGEENYTLVKTLTPVVVGDVAGFEDADGNFYSGDGLRAGGAVKTLPGDPYVESPNRNSFFDTGYYVTSNTCIVCDYMLLEQQKSPQQFPFEAGDSSDGSLKTKQQQYMRMYGNGSTGQGDFSYACGASGFTSMNVPYAPHVRRTLTLDAYNLKGKIETAGQVIREVDIAAAGRLPNRSGTTLKLLCNYNMTGNKAKARLYGLKIYEEGQLVRDYVPICHAGTYALRDKVTGTALEKASSSAALTGFTANNALNDSFFNAAMRAEDAYIESDGTQGIDMSYFTTPQTRYEIDYQMTAIRGQNRPFGAAAGNLSAELYVQGEVVGSGNVAFGVGNSWKGQYTNMGADLDRHVAFLDLANRECGYSGKGLFAFSSDTVCNRNSSLVMSLFTKGEGATFGGGADKNRTAMKLYAFRIYEAGALVHEWLPYKVGDVVGIYDTMTGEVKTNDVAGGNAFTYGGGLGYGKFAGAITDLVMAPQDAAASSARPAVLKAYAPGAVRYVWTKDGEVVSGASGAELEVPWESRSRSQGAFVYGVTPVFLKGGEEVYGAEATAEVEMVPRGMVLMFN